MAKKQERLQRSFSVDLDPRNLFEFEGLVMDFDTQKLRGIKDGVRHPLIGESRLEYKRARKNGEPKTLHTSINPDEDIWFSTNHQLIAYDHLIAVDTNTNKEGDSTVSITAAFHLIPRDRGSDKAFCHTRVLALFETWNVVEKPENIGWWQVLRAIQTVPEEFEGTIGLIVDSDLGEHQGYNKKTKPIIGDFYLPDNVKLIYASDKGGPEHLSSKMIKYCHDLAADLYKNHSLLLYPGGISSGAEGLFTHFRQWDTDKMELRSFAKP